MVALSALSKFASSFYTEKINMEISYDYLNNNQTTLQINEKNRLLLQKKKMITFSDNEINKVNFNIKGYGTALFQV